MSYQLIGCDHFVPDRDALSLRRDLARQRADERRSENENFAARVQKDVFGYIVYVT